MKGTDRSADQDLCFHIRKIVQKPALNIKLEKQFRSTPPLKRFDGFMLKMIQWANFLAWVSSLNVDSSY